MKIQIPSQDTILNRVESLGKNLAPEMIFVTLYNEWGIKSKTFEILNNSTLRDIEPVVYTHALWVSKVKPILPVVICLAHGAPFDGLRIIAASVDILWTLSAIVDDIADGDPIRRDQPSAWVKFGKKETYAAAQACYDIVLRTLERESGASVASLCKRYVEIGISSIEEHQRLGYDCTLRSLRNIYSKRDAFFSKFPVDAAFLKFLPEKKSERRATIGSLVDYYYGGQIGNDLQDLSISGYSTYRFSDLRNSQASVPLIMLWRTLSHREKQWVSTLRGRARLESLEIEMLSGLIENNGIFQKSLKLIELAYERAQHRLMNSLATNELNWMKLLCRSQLNKFSNFVPSQ